MNLYKNKYRIPSARLDSWNYGAPGFYFVTICTRQKTHYFGQIIETVMIPTAIGEVAESEWYKTLELRPDMNLQLGEFVVMPNHIHGIILIGENEFNSPERLYEQRHIKAVHKNDAMNCISANVYGPQRKNLASVIRGYKSAVTTFARMNDIEFAWQARYHDHIIRSVDEYQKISQYILSNPAQWAGDCFYQ